MKTWASVSAARVRGIEKDMAIVPYGWRHAATRYPVVWAHGAGADYKIGPVEAALAELLLSPWICTDQPSSRSWGSDAVLTAIEQDRAWAVANLGAKADKAILVGGSMGGLNVILFALANPAKVAAVVANLPALDPEWVRNNDPEGGANTTAMNTTYGGAVPAAKQAYQRGADFAATGVPLLLTYSTTDPFTPLASTQEFIAESGCETVNLGAVGHNYLTAPVVDMASFLYGRRS